MSSSSSKIDHARVVLSGVAPIPWRAHAAEQVLLGANVDEELFEQAAQAALQGAAALRLNGWKIPLAKALVRRALQRLVEKA